LYHEPLANNINWGPHQLCCHGRSHSSGGISDCSGRGIGEPPSNGGGGDFALGHFERRHVKGACGDCSHQGGAETSVETSETLVPHDGPRHVAARDFGGGHLLTCLQNNGGVDGGGDGGEERCS